MLRSDEHDAVHRITLDNDDFEGENNAYLLTGDGPTVLVDTSYATEDARARLEAGLADFGVTLADIDTVLLTHWHSDHTGLAGAIQAASDATVYIHETDAPIVDRDGDARESMYALIERRFEAWGVPDRQWEIIVDIFDEAAPAEHALPVVEPVDADEVIPAGDVNLRVLPTPGHTAGHAAYVIEGTAEAIVGDAVLPEYTPNIGGADLRVERPLTTYLETLETLETRGFSRLFPGHRDPIDEPTDRIRSILDHHRERTRRVVEVLASAGPASPWEVSAHLFGELEGIHILHGPGEAYAHLDHLATIGAVSRSGHDYRLETAPEEAVAAI